MRKFLFGPKFSLLDLALIVIAGEMFAAGHLWQAASFIVLGMMISSFLEPDST